MFTVLEAVAVLTWISPKQQALFLEQPFDRDVSSFWFKASCDRRSQSQPGHGNANRLYASSKEFIYNHIRDPVSFWGIFPTNKVYWALWRGGGRAASCTVTRAMQGSGDSA